MINITTPTHHPSTIGSLASLDATFTGQTPHTNHDGSPSEPSTQDNSHATPEKTLNQLKGIKKRNPQIVFNVSDTKYDIVKYVGEKIYDWRLSYDRNAEWDIFWTDWAVEPETLSKMHPYQKINHFPGMYCLARKNHLGKHLMRMRKAFPAEYKFFPETYLLPAEYTEFSVQCTNKISTYIVKPEASCQGRGIFLTRTGENIQPGERYVVQKYLANPYLIDGLKFDLRVYVLLAGCDPLRIYVFEDGLVRLATEPYVVPSGKNMENMCMHLTNYAVNKANPNFVFNSSEENDDVGHKRSLKSLMKMLEEKGQDTKTLWKEIKKLITKTFISVQPLLAQNYRTCQADEPYNNMCFEILGFDIMLDSQLKPYLLEVNHTPSFTTDTPLDRNIKKNVIKDALKLMNISLETKFAYKKKKRIELRKRILTGKGTKTSAEERKAEVERAQRERDEWENNNLGGFQKVFPLDDPSQADEDYDKLLKEATKWYDTFTGLAVKRNDKKPPGSEAGKTPPMVFGMGSPTNKPGAASNRDAQNVMMQKLRRPVNTARNGSLQIPSINNDSKNNLGTYPSKNDLSMAGSGSLNVDKKEEEEKTGTKSSFAYNGRTSIKMDDSVMSDKRLQGEDEDDPSEQSNKFSQRSRFTAIKIFENSSVDDKAERSSQDSRDASQDRSTKHQHYQEPEKSQFFKIKSNQNNNLPKDYVYMNKNKDREAMKPKSPNANTAPYLVRTFTNASAMGRYEDYLASQNKLYATETTIHDKNITDETFQVGSMNHLHLQRRETVGRMHTQTQSRSIRTHHAPTRSIQKDYVSVPSQPRSQAQLWTFLSPRTFDININLREPIVEYQREATFFGGGQKQIVNRTHIKKDNPNRRVVMTNNMFGDDRMNANQLFSNNIRRK